MAVQALLAGALCAQPRFEVASIRPASEAEQASGSSGVTTGKGRLNAQNVTLRRCIIGAYEVGPNQVVGGPAWLDSARWDIQAKSEAPTDDDVLMMKQFQTLLAERFQLVVRRDTREMRAYILDAAKNGPKLQKSAPGGEFNTNGSHGRIEGTAATLPHLAERLARVLDLPVVDRTGIEGEFDYKLRWTPEGDKVGPDSPPGIFTAVQEQLGLKLTGGRAPVAVIVIERAAMPSEN